MSLVKTWYTVSEAVDKFGMSEHDILLWVEEGLVRTEQVKGEPLRVNGDDLELQAGEIAGP
ncbi:MerR family transcriptional regulator [Geobacter sp. DSM 9736]|uniref:MerR family transcriptional regulator n=1 Tax=Geobacter sp. DSM 9736 TaxID=1277350 RepID=UPI000B505E4F|nr:MerR family transcriptional regulator [Geobacter sp. DSM 9736]SNB46754.1 hypothetical protein SAMN06269301_2224 [Geobacter sp. DSM 9736]